MQQSVSLEYEPFSETLHVLLNSLCRRSGTTPVHATPYFVEHATLYFVDHATLHFVHLAALCFGDNAFLSFVDDATIYFP